ncbi:MAG TPA: hypothetical protein DHV42_01605 [Lachnospiraceae bacterium]|nr:hypothetical protein [Lachnospiraceae bacterium]
MIKKLQKKFIMIAGLAVVIVMVCVLFPINMINRYRVGNELRNTIRYIMDSGGDFSEMQETESEHGGRQNWIFDFIARNPGLNFTPESKYQLRYFMITVEKSGTVSDVSLSHIAAVGEEDATALAQRAMASFPDSGFLSTGTNSYFYLRQEKGEGATKIGFLECTREVINLQVFSYVSIGFGLVLIVVFVIVIAILSRKAMQPYIDNIESQREFITNAGHELKTPLAIISANAEVIEMINGKSEWTDSILAQVKRGTSLINDLITLSRTTEAEQIVLTDVDASKILQESAESFRPVIEKEGKRLSIQIQEGVMVRAEEKMMTELCNILVDNAAKYCDDGGEVTVLLKKRGKGAQIQVSNTYQEGAGEDYGRFFRRFYRGDVSHNSKQSGYGIGLSMAQTIAEKFRGSIAAGWKNGVITFTVTL